MRTYRDSELVDFAIVGSGAAGGVIARELSRAGLSVVLLEQGQRYTPAQFEHDELKHWFLAGITNDAVKNPQTFRDDPDEERRLRRPQAALVRVPVGGTTVHYTANYWRFHPIDFHERSMLGPRGDGLRRLADQLRSWSRITRRSSGRSACPVSRARAPSIRRAPGPIRCRQCQ
jgi:choline dehydrogenase-like flavoprotein